MRVCQFRHFGTGIASGFKTRSAASSSFANAGLSVKEKTGTHPRPRIGDLPQLEAHFRPATWTPKKGAATGTQDRYKYLNRSAISPAARKQVLSRIGSDAYRGHGNHESLHIGQ